MADEDGQVSDQEYEKEEQEDEDEKEEDDEGNEEGEGQNVSAPVQGQVVYPNLAASALPPLPEFETPLSQSLKDCGFRLTAA